MSDPRLTPANGRIAAAELRGQVEAERFVEGEDRRVLAPVLDLRCDPSGPGLDRQLLWGDRFRVLEEVDGLAFGQAGRGGYVGWVQAAALGPWCAPTHRVTARATLAFDAPEIKTPAPLRLSLGAEVTVTGQTGSLSALDTGHFVPAVHLAPVDTFDADPVEIAARVLGAPYLWGGNSSDGIDCSGLVQLALLGCGIACPGDSDQQRDAFPRAQGAPRRGDLVFWAGHVAMFEDAQTLIHANGHHMAVAREDFATCTARIRASEGKDILKIARPEGGLT